MMLQNVSKYQSGSLAKTNPKRFRFEVQRQIAFHFGSRAAMMHHSYLAVHCRISNSQAAAQREMLLTSLLDNFLDN